MSEELPTSSQLAILAELSAENVFSTKDWELSSWSIAHGYEQMLCKTRVFHYLRETTCSFSFQALNAEAVRAWKRSEADIIAYGKICYFFLGTALFRVISFSELPEQQNAVPVHNPFVRLTVDAVKVWDSFQGYGSAFTSATLPF